MCICVPSILPLTQCACSQDDIQWERWSQASRRNDYFKIKALRSIAQVSIRVAAWLDLATCPGVVNETVVCATALAVSQDFLTRKNCAVPYRKSGVGDSLRKVALQDTKALVEGHTPAVTCYLCILNCVNYKCHVFWKAITQFLTNPSDKFICIMINNIRCYTWMFWSCRFGFC